MNLKFNNEKLYDLLLPALETKEIQLRRNDYLDISKETIFKYFVENVWKDESNIRLSQMVSDILNMDNEILNKYKEL